MVSFQLARNCRCFDGLKSYNYYYFPSFIIAHTFFFLHTDTKPISMLKSLDNGWAASVGLCCLSYFRAFINCLYKWLHLCNFRIDFYSISEQFHFILVDFRLFYRHDIRSDDTITQTHMVWHLCLCVCVDCLHVVRKEWKTDYEIEWKSEK